MRLRINLIDNVLGNLASNSISKFIFSFRINLTLTVKDLIKELNDYIKLKNLVKTSGIIVQLYLDDFELCPDGVVVETLKDDEIVK